MEVDFHWGRSWIRASFKSISRAHRCSSLLPCSTGVIVWHMVTVGGAGLCQSPTLGLLCDQIWVSTFPERVLRVQPGAENPIPQLATFWKPEAKPWGLAIRHLRVTVRLFLVTHEVINREHHLADFTVEARLVPYLEDTEKNGQLVAFLQTRGSQTLR